MKYTHQKNDISPAIFLKQCELLREIKKEKGDLKFSAVLGAMSAKSSILILPAGIVPMVTSKKTMGFLGFGGRRCHSTAAAPEPATAVGAAVTVADELVVLAAID